MIEDDSTPCSVLLIDDEPFAQDIISHGLGSCSVLEACDAAGAVELIESGRQIDLVFSDVIMPGPVSSLQLRDVLRAHLPEAQILYTSGYAEGVLAHSGKLDASVHLLQKPYHQDALSARIRHLLRQRKQHQPVPGTLTSV
jgi:CheY-like chemotaxis protein